MPELVRDVTGNDLTYRIIGAAMAVHNTLGLGYKEEVYERALSVELDQRGIPAQRQFPVEVWHENVPVALFYLDLWVDEQVVVEIKALAREVSASGVRVNAVAPGPINTPLVMALSDEWRKTKAAELPLGRFGEPEEVAAAVAFLCSPDASLFVGQTIGPNSGDVML